MAQGLTMKGDWVEAKINMRCFESGPSGLGVSEDIGRLPGAKAKHKWRILGSLLHREQEL